MSEAKHPSKPLTARRGTHRTRWTVKLADRVSRVVITVGGIGTIVALCLVFLLLLAVVLPLLRSGRVGSVTEVALPTADRSPLVCAVDEYRTLAWTLAADGQLSALRLDTGEVVFRDRLVDDGVQVRAASWIDAASQLLLGRSDGRWQLASIVFQSEFADPSALPPSIDALAPGQLATWQNGVVQVTPQQQFRYQRVKVERGTPLEVVHEPMRQLDHVATRLGVTAAGVTESGRLVFARLRQRKNVLTGETSWTSTVGDLPAAVAPDSPADRVLVSGRGERLLAIWLAGQAVRYDLRSAEAVVAESIELLPPAASGQVTAAELIMGGETLLVGDSEGGLRAWFSVRHPDAKTPDGRWLLPIHELSEGPAVVDRIGSSQRSRLAAVGYRDGGVGVLHVTTASEVVTADAIPGQPVDHVLLAPKDDGLLAVASGRLWSAELDPAYPEARWSSLFRPVWYEGYDEPEHVWQSSFAGVESEMKLGLAPLVFGTFKATLYCMLFGAPLALLAAIYTSEFLDPHYRNRVKSLVEMMASLPSVVLGFLGGLVIAPLVERIVPTLLCAFVLLPICCLLGGTFWQQLPSSTAIRWSRYRLACVLVCLITGVAAAWTLGPLAERWFFAGDIMLWLDQQRGTGTGGWWFVLLPLSGLSVAAIVSLRVNPWLMRMSGGWSRRRCAATNLVKNLLGLLATVGLPLLMGLWLTQLGWDPRGSLTGTYVQRNAMVVGFVMGFAIIPIVYTIAEDSLSTVPRHLRSASLGAGATPLQTALRVVVPTAMSGLFSAVMIGLGRAVGETMIVLMAAGNTPLMEWNIFNGFRTLSANIAVELPEAVRHSTHYRTLFLAALTLLLLTFFINTIAELVRLQFRRRALQL